jgi:enterochelin esterase-like enzyme
MRYSDSVRWLEHESDVLRGNPLGDPHIRKFPVYVPADYEFSSDKRYPVVFMLTGFTGSGVNYLNYGFQAPNFNVMIDDLIAEGMPPAIFVFVDCMTGLGGSQYVNSSATGNYDDYIVQELVPFIDEQFRTTGMRGCVGGSSGGIGSFVMGAKHPDVFQGFADHSGDSAFEYCYLADVPAFVQDIAKYDYDIGKFIAQIPEIYPRDNSFMNLINFIAMSACYAPNPDSEHGFDLPFDPYDGTLRLDVWAKFRENDPVHMVKRYANNLRKLRFIFVDCGTKDQFHLYLGSRQLHRQLEAHSINHVYEEYDSDHFLLRRLQEKKSIPMLLKALTKS